MKSIKILSIETSCDEAAVSFTEVFEDCSTNIIFERIHSQVELHSLYGGVVPELAAREHLKSLPILMTELQNEIPDLKNSVDEIAVTSGPGLKGCLLMGINFAKGLGLAWNKPVYGINHIEGHLFSAFIKSKPIFPFLALIVSGGHTELVLVESVSNYKVISKTIDDAAGEAFDKSANLLVFSYPGGAKLAAAADSIKSSQFKLPVAMKGKDGFSFSGLKTAISLLIKKHSDQIEEVKNELCFAIQESITNSLCEKVQNYISENSVSTLCLVGGVAANLNLNEKLKNICKKNNIDFLSPNKFHATDNATMIGYIAGIRHFYKKEKFSTEVLPRWPLGEL